MIFIINIVQNHLYFILLLGVYWTDVYKLSTFGIAFLSELLSGLDGEEWLFFISDFNRSSVGFLYSSSSDEMTNFFLEEVICFIGVGNPVFIAEFASVFRGVGY